MDLAARQEEYNIAVDGLAAIRSRLMRQSKGNAPKRKSVEEYVALYEEVAAVSYDVDRATHKLEFCDPQDEKGKVAKAGYEAMIEKGTARLAVIRPLVEKLEHELGIEHKST